MKNEKILLTGSGGQLGTALRKALADKYGSENIVATDLVAKSDTFGDILSLDATDQKQLESFVESQEITQIYHLAAILSANGEANPIRTWDINLKSWLNVLETARKFNVEKIFFPSSIAVFGTTASKTNTSQTEFLDPLTVYGVSKASGEQWGNYYFSKHGIDVRSLRYPGVIGHESLPGGGTTDYAVDIYHKAIKNQPYTCYLFEDTALPMIFMADAVRATLELMDAPSHEIKTRTSYNLNGLSFTPKEIVKSINKWYPEFQVEYRPDFRQEIAKTWPSSVDDSEARNDWHWSPRYMLDDISNEMITELLKKQSLQKQS